MFIDPPDGVVDARQPHPPDDATQAQGIDAIRVRAPVGTGTQDLLGRPQCWDLCETDDNDDPNEITSVRDNFDGTFTFQLSRPITPGAVTTLTYTDYTGVRRATGTFTSHPGNVDGNAMSDGADVTAIVAILNGGPALWDPYSMDIDRNGRFAPADMLRVIDLFNGSEDYDAWLGTAKPLAGDVCPPSE